MAKLGPFDIPKLILLSTQLENAAHAYFDI